MATKSVEDVLQELEKVFSGEVEYDEALMNLSLHTAQVRKQYPNLFSAISKKEKSDNILPQFEDFKRLLIEALSKNQNGLETLGYKDVMPVIVPSILYSVWATTEALAIEKGQKVRIKWDVPSVPMPQMDATWTLRQPTRRARFKVIETSEDELVFEMIASLPLNSG